jgi:hypothetical protein
MGILPPIEGWFVCALATKYHTQSWIDIMSEACWQLVISVTGPFEDHWS